MKMIRLLRLSNHELRFKWANGEYSARPFKGHQSAISIFEELFEKIDTDRAALIRSNLLFPTGKDADLIIEAHANARPVMRAATFSDTDEYRTVIAGSQEPHGSKTISLSTITFLLDELVYKNVVNKYGHPYIAEVFINLEN